MMKTAPKTRFKLSLYQRLSLSLSFIFIIITLVFYLWSSKAEQNFRLESQQQLHLSLAANLARDNPLLQQGNYDHHALKNLFHTLMVLGPAFEFYFVDPKGKLLTYSGDSYSIKRDTIDIMPIMALTHNKQALPIYGDDPRHVDRQKIFSAAPVFNGSSLQGYLYIIVTSQLYDSAFAKTTSAKHAQNSILLVCSALLFLFIVTLGLFGYFTKPLRQLIKNINAHPILKDNQLTATKFTPCNEVQHLGEIFEGLMQKIHQQMSLLQQLDNHRREMLADISHDLRTPLSSLQGYVETLQLNHQTLTVEQRQTYLTTALNNAQQLKKLIDQLFELAHLENENATINIEQFNVIEFIHDVAAKFRLKMHDKQLSLTITPSQGNIQVSSDIGKLERVLSNLLENAIRHSHNKGNITIEVEPKKVNNASEEANEEANKEGSVEQITAELPYCAVTVADNGTGIKQDEIAYIFDPRYRGSNAIEDNDTHNGLGLAITKKLLQLLNSDIKVISKLNKGSRFSFDLLS